MRKDISETAEPSVEKPRNEYGIEMYVDTPDEHWLPLETGLLSLTYARVALEMYQAEFPERTVRIVQRTITFKVIPASSEEGDDA